MTTPNVPILLSVRVPVTPTMRIREAFAIGTFAEKSTEMRLLFRGYGVECFHDAAVISGFVILSGGVVSELVSWAKVRLGMYAPWSQPDGIFLALIQTGCGPWPHKGFRRSKQNLYSHPASMVFPKNRFRILPVSSHSPFPGVPPL